MRARARNSERAQVVPLLAAVVVFAGLAMIALGHLGGGAVERAEARRAADAAALAGAAEGRVGADRLADANNATVARYDESGHDAEVVVHYGQARAIARARRDGGGIGTRPGDPAPALRAALARAAQILGHKPHVVRAHDLVVDLTADGYAELEPRAAEAGLCPSAPNQMRVCGAD
jgi:hypothetical protein